MVDVIKVKASEGGMPWVDGWYCVTVQGAPLETARPLYVMNPDGTMATLRLTAAEEAALEQLDPDERDYTPLADTAAEEAVVELVRVTDGREAARETLFAEPADAFAGSLPESAEQCWTEVRALDRELAATKEATVHWPRAPRGRRLALREARIRALLTQAANLGDLLAQERLGREAFEAGDDAEALRWLADLTQQSALARSVLAVMGLEGRLPEGMAVPEVSAGSPWPLAQPMLRAFIRCREGLNMADLAPRARSFDLAVRWRQRAVGLLREAAEAGYAYAQFRLARLLGGGLGEDLVAADEARRWLRAAALGGCREAAKALETE